MRALREHFVVDLPVARNQILLQVATLVSMMQPLLLLVLLKGNSVSAFMRVSRDNAEGDLQAAENCQMLKNHKKNSQIS